MEDMVPLWVDEPRFLLGIASPQEKNQPLPGFAEPGDYRVGKALPPFVLMTPGLVRANREGGVEQ